MFKLKTGTLSLFIANFLRFLTFDACWKINFSAYDESYSIKFLGEKWRFDRLM